MKSQAIKDNLPVQVFDNTAASRDGTLQSGDEITGVNGVNVKGKSKQEVAQLIQRSEVCWGLWF